MSVIAVKPGYKADIADRQEKFHGNQLLYIGWEDHLLYAAPVCVAVPPGMPFGALVEQVLPGIYGDHPDWPLIDWATVEWRHSGQPFVPDPGRSLVDNGLGHKAVIRLRTPGLTGIAGACI
jgi:phenol hydroxylase P4 protein